MKSKLRLLYKNSIVYGIGGVLNKGILFFLLPVYTRIFAPAEYGVIETLTMCSNFLIVFLVMGMDAAQSFYFFEQGKNGKAAQSRLVTAIFQWRLLWGSLITIAVIFLSPIINNYFFNGKLTIDCFIIAFSSALAAQFMAQSAEVFRLLYKPLKQISIFLGYAIISGILSVIFTAVYRLGLKGYFLGFLIGGVTTSIYGWWAAREYLDFSAWHKEWWPKLTKFGYPLILGGIAMYILYTTDRWFIIHYHGQAALGIYAVGSKFVVLLSLIVNGFRQAWMAIGMEAIHKPDGHELFRVVSRFYLGLGVISIVVFTALSPLLITLFSEHRYHSAYPIISILSWEAIFYGFFLTVTPGIWKSKKTIWSSITMVIAAITNIILDFFLVPQFGGTGAAVATSVSLFVWVLATLVVSERFWPVNYPVGIFSLQIITGIVGCLGILSVYQKNMPVWYIGIMVFITSVILLLTMLPYSKFIVICQYAKTRVVSENI